MIFDPIQHARTVRQVNRAQVNKLAAEILQRAGQTPEPDQQPVLQLAEWGLNNNLGPVRPGEGCALGQYLDEPITYADQLKVFKFLTFEDGAGPYSTALAEQLEDRKNDAPDAAEFLLEYLLMRLRAAGHSVP